jgi:methylmalonyl-CoA epimerase
VVVKIEHIGIVVKDLEASLQKYADLLGLQLKEVEEVTVGGAVNRLAFLPVRDTTIELVQATAKTGLAADFLRERGEGVHHIALEVEDVDAAFHGLRAKGAEFVWDKVIDGSRGSRVAFLKPELFNGVYIELVQRR